MTGARRAQAGLTLVELMIAMVISGIVVTAALAMGFSLMNSYRDHRAMVLVERSARVSLEIISQAARGSIPGVPLGQVEDLIGCTGKVGLYIENSSTGPDAITVVYATGGVYTSLRNLPYDASSTKMQVLGTPDPDDPTDRSGMLIAPGDYVVITDLNNAAITRVEGVTAVGSEYELTTLAPSDCSPPPTLPAGGFLPGSLVIRARLAKFFIQNDSETADLPTLMMDPDGVGSDALKPEPMAQGIEDMQIAIAYDRNANGVIDPEVGAVPDDDDWVYNVEGDSALPLDAVPRAIRITLVARSLREQSDVASYTPPEVVEDHTIDSPTPDPFRRRVLTTTVEIRNHGESL